MESNFKNKKALVTGAGKGIGREIARKLVELGAETVALSRTQADLDSLKLELPTLQTVQCDLQDWHKTREILQTIKDVDLLVNNAGVTAVDPFLEVKKEDLDFFGNIMKDQGFALPTLQTVQCDLRDWHQTREVLQTIKDVDLLVNNAGVIACDPFLEVRKEDLDFVFDINFKAVFNVSQVIAKSMVERGQGGVIVNVSSVASHVILKDHAVYGSTKAAVDHLTRTMALELGPQKIRVNAVNPTVTMTDMGRKAWSDPAKADPMLARIPMGRFLDMSDIVDGVMFLLSDKAAMIHGVMLPIEGGLMSS